MAVPSALTKLPSVAPVGVEEVAAASVVVEATTLEAEEATVEEEVAIVSFWPAFPLVLANIARRRWRRLWWWT